MLKFVFLFALVIAAALAEPGPPCEEKPCTKEFDPISVIDIEQKCHEFTNPCMLQNAIHCGRILPDVCVKGKCGSLVVIQCPKDWAQE